MDESIYLIILQTICLTVNICNMFMLGLSRFHLQQTDKNYETTRWILISVSAILSLHYWAQIHFGFRAQGDDVGALVNILFYSPAAYMLSYSSTRMAIGTRHSKQLLVVAVTSMVLTVVIFIAGWCTYQSLHMPHALYTMSFVFLLTMCYFIFHPVQEIRKAWRLVEDENGGDLGNYNLYMRAGTVLVFGLAIFLPLAIFSTYVLAVFGPLFFIALFFYMLSFVLLGFNVNSIADIIESSHDGESAENTLRMDEKTAAMISERISTWIDNHRYVNPGLTLANVAMELKIDKKRFAQYLSEQKGLTFRVWLSDLRIEEVKQMLLEHTEYSNDSIAMACGFTSRSWMHQRFKTVTGMTPNEWREKQK